MRANVPLSPTATYCCLLYRAIRASPSLRIIHQLIMIFPRCYFVLIGNRSYSLSIPALNEVCSVHFLRVTRVVCIAGSLVFICSYPIPSSYRPLISPFFPNLSYLAQIIFAYDTFLHILLSSLSLSGNPLRLPYLNFYTTHSSNLSVQ